MIDFVKRISNFNTKNNKIDDLIEVMDDFINQDRTSFIVAMLLPLDSSLKGMMICKLLENNNRILEFDINEKFESKIIFDVLIKEELEKSLKNLLVLKQRRINNSRAKRVILKFIFDRSDDSLENCAIMFKRKVSDLVAHALGHSTCWNILNGNENLFRKNIGKYTTNDCINVMNHLFNYPINPNKKQYSKIKDYQDIKHMALISDEEKFIDILEKNSLPQNVLLGLRNFYKLNIPLHLFESL